MFKFERLAVWQKAVDLYVDVAAVTDRLPARERYSLGDQLRRAALSVSANIAKGSVYEVISLLEVTRRSSRVDDATHTELYSRCDEIAWMLSGLLQK